MLAKRTNKPVTKDIINQIVTRELASNVKKSGVEITNRYVSDIDLLENMFPAVYCGTANPEIEKLKDFFRV